MQLPKDNLMFDRTMSDLLLRLKAAECLFGCYNDELCHEAAQQLAKLVEAARGLLAMHDGYPDAVSNWDVGTGRLRAVLDEIGKEK